LEQARRLVKAHTGYRTFLSSVSIVDKASFGCLHD
jgi:hypothetical protein